MSAQSNIRIKNKYKHYTYDKDGKNLLKSLSYPEINTEEEVSTSLHFPFFHKYLYTDPEGLNIKTIIVEYQYFSESYKSDYLNFYAHTHNTRYKACRRVHFFSKKFDESTFLKMLKDNDSENWKSYCGYIVIKPMKRGYIGATLLKHPSKPGHNYTAVKDFPVNLFGTKLKINSMPYQEQDSVIGSCATLSLWFAFHITSELFKKHVPTPSQITIDAGYDNNHTGKLFPSNGLIVPQICRAIKAIGLVSEYRFGKNILQANTFRGIIYAYLRMGIPILMGLDIERIGLHLIAINGYKESKVFKNKGLGNVKLLSDGIEEFFAHDDQTGPFSTLSIRNRKKDKFHLVTSWEIPTSTRPLNASPIAVIVPIIEEIRVDYETILDEVTSINDSFLLPLDFKFDWGIFLIESNKYKMEIKVELERAETQRSYDGDISEVLFYSLPKYIWVARAQSSNYWIFDTIYDASEAGTVITPFYTNVFNKSFKDAIIFNDEFRDVVKSIGIFDKYIAKRQKNKKNKTKTT